MNPVLLLLSFVIDLECDFFQTEAMVELQKTNPQLFNQYLKSGAIRLIKGGKIEVNPTLARELLDRGLRGSSESMAKYTYLKQVEIENSLRRQFVGKTTPVAIKEAKGYVALLKQINDSFKGTTLSKRADKAQTLLNKVQNASPAERFIYQSSDQLLRPGSLGFAPSPEAQQATQKLLALDTAKIHTQDQLQRTVKATLGSLMKKPAVKNAVNNWLKTVKTTTPKQFDYSKMYIKAVDALELRRFLDAQRVTSSFRSDPILSSKQEMFKVGADNVRGELAKLSGVKNLMNEYRIYIQAFDSIVQDAVRRDNRNLINLTDLIVGGGGFASGFPGTGIGAAVFIKAFQSPTSFTGLGSTLEQVAQPVQRLFGPSVQQGIRQSLFPFIGSGRR